ncbi:MAG: helix-turn-helix domain-containing protein [Acidimicrobiales bacterium]
MARRAPTLDVHAVLVRLVARPPGPRDVGLDDGTDVALLDATSALLSRYGMKRWSMDDVSERSGIGRATIYRRFASRDDLLQAALARDARRFFARVAGAVAGAGTLEDKVVEGLLVGLAMVRDTLLPGLLESDRAEALSLLTAAPVLDLARAALVQSYRDLTGATPAALRAVQVDLVAEALVRLAISFILIPGSVVDLADPAAARPALHRLVGPLLAPAGQAAKAGAE